MGHPEVWRGSARWTGVTGAIHNGTTPGPVAVCAADRELADRLARALSAGGLQVTAVVAAGDDLERLEPTPRVVVLVHPGVTSRAALIHGLRSRLPGLQVVVVASAARGHEVRSALEAGASGFVFEEELDATLVLTVRASAVGQVVVPRRERRQVHRPTLSAREKQILGLVVMGYMNCEIAQRLFLAESTVKSHLSSAFAKLGVHSRNEAVDLILDGQDRLGRGILAITGEDSGLPSSSAA